MLSYTGRLGLVQRLVAMLQDDGVTRVSYQGPTEAGGSPEATETVLLAVRVAARPESLAYVRAKVDEFLHRHQGVTLSVEGPATSGPPQAEGFVAELESLARLHSNGQLTDDEFRRAKVRLLGQ